MHVVTASRQVKRLLNNRLCVKEATVKKKIVELALTFLNCSKMLKVNNYSWSAHSYISKSG